MQYALLTLLLVTPAQADVLNRDGLVAVTFLGVECPLGKLYANRLNELSAAYPGVEFLAINSNQQDTADEVAEFAKFLSFEMLKDNDLADRLGATRSPEVFLLQDGRVIYQGRIDDQYVPGVHGRTEPSRRDLAIAIEEAQAGKPISEPLTEAVGCYISKVRKPEPAAVTYEQVAPIIARRCAECHRPGEAAPFSLLSYEDTASWADTIREVITEKRMPPWGAEGDFKYDRSLAADERATVLAWLDAGAPEGRPVDPIKVEPTTAVRADLVLSAAPFTVPKEGLLDYQEFVVDPGLAADTWIQGVEVRPGRRSAVHHVNVYARPKTVGANTHYVNAMQDAYLATAVPGSWATAFPVGIAKVIPADCNVVIQIHYVTNGESQVDQTSVAFEYATEPVREQMATRVLLDESLVIEPNSKKTAVQTWTTEEDYTLHALFPHMHLRGRSMRFEATYPDGQKETLANVYAFDFAWQSRYVLREPRVLPKGTVLTCTAEFDNTAENPNNPDPSSQVRSGKNTTDEMFQSNFEVSRPIPQSQHSPIPVVAGLGFGVLYLITRLRGRK